MKLTKADWIKAARWHAKESRDSAATAKRYQRIAAGAKAEAHEEFSCGLLKGWLAPNPFATMDDFS